MRRDDAEPQRHAAAVPVRDLRPRDRAGGAGRCPLARPGRQGGCRGRRVLRGAPRTRAHADRGQGRDRRRRRRRPAVGRVGDRCGRGGVRPRARPARRPRRRRARRHERRLDDRGRTARIDPLAPRHVHAQDGGRAARARVDRPAATRRRQHPFDRRGLRAHGERRHRDRARPAAAPRPDRGDPCGGGADQADPGRRRDRVDQRRRARHERPPRDRHRRHPPGGARGGGAALPRRRASGATLADAARRDRRGARPRDRRHRAHLHDRRPRAPGGDRRGDRRLERRPAARRPLPRRLGPHALARHVHALQLGSFRRRHPFLRPRPA